jgi:uncharacterized protein (TIGR02466 family)
MIREDLWANPIWIFDIPNSIVDTAEVEKECYLNQSLFPSRQSSNQGGYQSNNIDINAYPNILALASEIDKGVLIAAAQLNVRRQINLSIVNMWININSTGGYNSCHIHGDSLLSGVYYVKSPDLNQSIIFHNPCAARNLIASTFTTMNNALTFNTVEYKPIKGRLIIFPSWLPHEVKSNNHTEDRISISFNAVKIG